MRVFFYGLFMDEQLLATKGFTSAATRAGFVEGFELRIGERATLLPCSGARAYGLLMQLDPTDVADLYGEKSVADYAAETVLVKLADGAEVTATCYNLPIEKVAGTNKEYAASLHALATSLGFPESYLEQIK